MNTCLDIIRCSSLVILLVCIAFHNTVVSLAPNNIRFIPTTIQCEHVTQSYPITLLSKLFSSVPKRQYALQNIRLNFGELELGKVEDEHNFTPKRFCLLVGRSASGKSSLLRILSGDEAPVSGNVFLNGIPLYFRNKDHDESIRLPKPVIIDSKPDCFDDQCTVVQRIENALTRNNKELDGEIKRCLAVKIAQVLNLSDSQLCGFPSSLSPSGQYLFGLACASAASCQINLSDDKNEIIHVSSPVLLLDELLDSETSMVAAKVGEGLQNLARMGAVILCATHRPQYLVTYADRVITLSSGKVLMEDRKSVV